jgi:hypothetical protein
MFEFAAGQVQQEERERRIAEGLRRRELLTGASTGQAQPTQERRTAMMSAPRPTTTRAHAER